MADSPFSLPKHVVIIHFIIHLLFVGFIGFCRFYPGADNSHSVGWWDTYPQWGYWLCLLYYIFAAVVDWTKSVRLRRYRDKFFNLVFPVASTIGFGFWFLLLPINHASGGPNGYRPASSWDDFVEHYASTIIVPIFCWIELFMVTHKFGPLWVDILITTVFAGGYVVFDLLRWAITGTFIYPHVQSALPWLYWLIFMGLHILFFIAVRGIQHATFRLRVNRECCSDLLYDSDMDEMDTRPLVPSVAMETSALHKRYKDPTTPLGQAKPLIVLIGAMVVINVAFLISFLLHERSRYLAPNAV